MSDRIEFYWKLFMIGIEKIYQRRLQTFVDFLFWSLTRIDLEVSRSILELGLAVKVEPRVLLYYTILRDCKNF